MLRPFIGALRSAGVDDAKLLRLAQIDPAICDDDEARIELEHAQAFWAAMPAATGDDMIGLRASYHVRPELFEPPSLPADTGAIGSESSARTSRRTPPSCAQCELHVAGDRGALRIRYPQAVPRVVSDCFAAACVRFMREIAHGRLPVEEIHLSYPRPREAAAYQDFFELPVHFGQAYDALVFPAAMIDIRLRGTTESLCPVLEHRAAARLEHPASSTEFTRSVEQVLADELTKGPIDVAHVARRLNVSPRTLRRRLRTEGTHHGELLDRQRRVLASRYLAEGHTVAEVALLLGFAHPSTFTAAFKRWTGVTPRHAKHGRPPRRGPTGEERK